MTASTRAAHPKSYDRYGILAAVVRIGRADKLGEDYVLNFYLQLLLILGSATALAGWCGWGLARLALPNALQPYWVDHFIGKTLKVPVPAQEIIGWAEIGEQPQ